MNKFIRVIFLLIFILFLISCNKNKTQETVLSSSNNSSIIKTKPLIGFSIDTLALERWQRDVDVFLNTAKDLGAEVIVQNSGNKIDEQNRQLLYLADKKVDVIVVIPEKADELIESIQKVRSKNIPVISYDRLVRNVEVDMYISVDSRKVGILMAQNMMRISNATNWHCILGPKEDFNITLIESGIQSVIKYTPVHIVHTFYTQGWNYDLSYQEMVNLITGRQIPEAIICGNDAVAGSVLQAMSTFYPDHHIPICGQDADIAACQNIVRGNQDFTVYKPITDLAEKAAQCAVAIAEGTAVSELCSSNTKIDNGAGKIPVIWLEPTVVDKTNIDDVVINSGFHTYGEVYR